MFGIILRVASIATIAYPVYTTLDLLAAIQTSFTENKIALLTDTIPLPHQDAIKIQESISYWLILSLWLYILQLPLVSTALNILPLSSILVVYVQLWLGCPLVKLPSLPTKVSGAYIIHHYYYDNDMVRLRRIKKHYSALVGNIGVIACRRIASFPTIVQLLAVIGVNISTCEQYFTGISAKEPSHGTMNNWTQLWGITPNWKQSMVMANQPDIGILRTILNALLAPLGYSHIKEPFPILTKESVTKLATTTTKKTPSPASSFDDFAMVNEKELLDENSILLPKRRSKDSTYKKNNDDRYDVDNDDDEKSSLLGTMRRVSSRSFSGSSSWFKTK